MTRFKLFVASLAALSAVFSSVLHADIIDNFYDVEVPVASNNQSEVKAAAGLGLQQMLIRMSGREDIMQNELLQDALRDANTKISQYGFVERETTDGETQTFVKFTFTQRIVEQLLNRAGAPVWTSDRPSALIWLAVDADSDLAVVNENHEAFKLLKHSAADRGMPFYSPLYDLEDRFTLSAEQLWQFDTRAILDASERYTSDTVVAMRALMDSRGQWHISWELFNDEKPLLGSESCLALKDCFDIATGELAKFWSDRYAVIQKYSAADNVNVTVKNLDFATYSALTAYWRGLPGVDGFEVTSVDGLDVSFSLVWLSDIGTLTQLIALHDHLRWLEDESSGNNLVLEWLP